MDGHSSKTNDYISSKTNDYIRKRLVKSNEKIKVIIDPLQISGFIKSNDSVVLKGGSFTTMEDNLLNLKSLSFDKICILLDHSNIKDYLQLYGYEFISLLKSYVNVTIYSKTLYKFDDGNEYNISLILPCSQCLVEDPISCKNPQVTEKSWLEIKFVN